MLDWLEEDHLCWFVIDAVKALDTGSFLDAHPSVGAGRPGYDPDMMLTLMLYAYANGMRSSRAIEAACRTDLAFKVICANLVPDHTTIAAFRAENEEAIKKMFVEVLKLCAAAGLACLGVIAIDGTKLGSDAALDRNRSSEWIRAEIDKIVCEASAADDSDDGDPQLFDTAALPQGLRRRQQGRLGRLKAALAEAQAQETAAAVQAAQRAEKAMAEAEAGRKLRGRKPKDPHAAAARAEADLAAARRKAEADPCRPGVEEDIRMLEARLAEAQKTAAAAPPAAVEVNLTDPDSRIMKTKDGWVQGFNVQGAVNQNQVVISYDVTQDHNDVGQFTPMVEATKANAAAAGIEEEIGLVLSDAGYWSEDNATWEGPDRLIATTKDWKQRKAARDAGGTSGPPPQDATPLEAMEHRLRTEQGAKSYATRSYTVEPVFGNIKDNRGFRRFMRRGLAAANSEAALIFASHNLMKIFTHQSAMIPAIA